MPMCFAHYDSTCLQPAPHQRDDKSGCAPPFQKSRSTPDMDVLFNRNTVQMLLSVMGPEGVRMRRQNRLVR